MAPAREGDAYPFHAACTDVDIARTCFCGNGCLGEMIALERVDRAETAGLLIDGGMHGNTALEFGARGADASDR